MNAPILVDDRIPVRNVWFLFLYAYNLAEFQGRFDAEIEESTSLKALVARLLCYVVENRLRRNLSKGYKQRRENLTRVRGRIDVLATKSQHLLQRGEIACRYAELTIDTPRNRLVRAALTTLSEILDRKNFGELVDRTRILAGILGRIGVSGKMPTRAELTADQIARYQSEDKLLVSLSRAVFDLILPTEQEGGRRLLSAQRDRVDFPRIFELAVRNFYGSELSDSSEWKLSKHKRINWFVSKESLNFKEHLPSMNTDIVLENKKEGRSIVIDTKFKDVLGSHYYSENRKFRSVDIYQMYTYIRSQEHINCNVEGILLYPAIGESVNEAAEIDGHILRFTTIDLAKPTEKIVQDLRQLPFQLPELVDS